MGKKARTSKVIVVRNIPHGFYEKQMMEFFSQFGPVTRLKLLRSRKYLKSKGIAFIEFKYDDIAKIVAHTMDNYLMFEKLLKCEVVPPGKLPRGIFKGWKGHPVSSIVMHKRKIGRVKSVDEWKQVKSKKLKLIRDVENKLEKLGIPFKCTIVDEPDEEETIADFVSIHENDSADESFVTCDSSPSPKLTRSFSEKRLSRSRSGMKRKLLCIPKYAILSAAKKLSL